MASSESLKSDSVAWLQSLRKSLATQSDSVLIRDILTRGGSECLQARRPRPDISHLLAASKEKQAEEKDAVWRNTVEDLQLRRRKAQALEAMNERIRVVNGLKSYSAGKPNAQRRQSKLSTEVPETPRFGGKRNSVLKFQSFGDVKEEAPRKRKFDPLIRRYMKEKQEKMMKEKERQAALYAAQEEKRRSTLIALAQESRDAALHSRPKSPKRKQKPLRPTRLRLAFSCELPSAKSLLWAVAGGGNALSRCKTMRTLKAQFVRGGNRTQDFNSFGCVDLNASA